MRGLDKTWGWNPRGVITLGRHHCMCLLKDLAVAMVLSDGGEGIMEGEGDGFLIGKKEVWNLIRCEGIYEEIERR